MDQDAPSKDTTVCAVCKRDIPPKDGRFHVGELSYHVGCYERPPDERKGR